MVNVTSEATRKLLNSMHFSMEQFSIPAARHFWSRRAGEAASSKRRGGAEVSPWQLAVTPGGCAVAANLAQFTPQAPLGNEGLTATWH
jgi:hypothetical protein